MVPAPEGPPKKPAGRAPEQAEDAGATQKFRTTAPTPKKPARETDLAGWKIDDFHLLRRLGGGGMAEVYLAEQLSLKRAVAFKVLRSDLAADEKYIRRFKREAEAAARINHAHIVQIYAVGQHDGIYYIAQEYVQGQNLKELLNRHGALPWRRAVEILRQAAAGLGRAAQAGIVHRDIKPENILLTRDGEVKVADFGLARQLGGEKPLNLTQEGVTMGTPLYMSPEQVEGKALDDRSDLYSLGVTAYHMLTGAPPFRGESALGVAVQHIKGQARPLKEVRPDLPDDLCRVVHKMLAKDPGERQQSAADLLEELSRVGTGEPPASEPAPKAPDRAERKKRASRAPAAQPARWSRGRLRWLYALSVVVALAAGALAGWFRREPDLFAEAAARAVEVPKKRSAFAQWGWANIIETNNEAAWKAVIDYWGGDPEAQLYVNRAKQSLAYFYLTQDRWDEAAQLFGELAELPDSDREFRAAGLAGEAVVFSLQGKYDASNLRLSRAFEQRNLLDSRMLDLVRMTLERNRAHGRQQDEQRWRKFLDEQESQAAQELEEP
jgi:tRNA A-37 threonylcarbamoyl transferase component Bud32